MSESEALKVRSAWVHLSHPPILGFTVSGWQPGTFERWVTHENFRLVLRALQFPEPLFQWLWHSFAFSELSSLWIGRQKGAFVVEIAMLGGDPDYKQVRKLVYKLCHITHVPVPGQTQQAEIRDRIKGQDDFLTDADTLALYLGGVLYRAASVAYGIRD